MYLRIRTDQHPAAPPRTAPLFRAAFAAAAVLALAPAALGAQMPSRLLDDTTRVLLEPLVVTAERERAAPPPVATTQLPAEAVHRSQADNPYDIARRVAGLEVHDHGQGPGYASNAVIRGFTSDHSSDVLLVVDGVPVNLPIHGHGEGYADWNSLLPAAVSSFRVIHGAASPLYGDFALGGVAEVFTAADANGTSASLSSSNYGDMGGWVLSGRRGESGGALAAMELRRTQGWRRNSEYGLFNGLLRGWRTVGAGRLEGGLALYGSDWNSPGFLTIADFDAERMEGVTDMTDGGDTRRAVLHGRYAVPVATRTSLQATAWGMLSEWSLFLTIPEEDDEDLWQTGDRDVRRGMGAQTELMWTPDVGEITLGVSARSDAAEYRTSRTAERRITSLGAETNGRHTAGALYARWRRTLGERLGLDLGGRVDIVRHASLDALDADAEWQSGTRVVASPKLGARYFVSDALSLRASTSRGFRSAVGVIGDPGREPILAWAHELGVDVAAGPLQASVALFRMDVSNERILDPVTRELSSAGSSRRQGVDVDARLRLWQGLYATTDVTWNDAWLNGHYAHAHEEHEEHEEEASGAPALSLLPRVAPRLQEEEHEHEGEAGARERVPGVARYTAKLGMEAEIGAGAQVHAAWRITGPYVPIGEAQIRTRTFSVVDLGTSIPLGRRLVLDAELQNALDAHYAELRASGFVTPGAPRSLRASLRFNPGVF